MDRKKSIHGDLPKYDGDFRPLWELTQAEFDDFQVTPLNKAVKVVWRFAPTTPGTGNARCQINWAMKLLDGSRLTEPQHSVRLAWGKKLMALILHAPDNGDVPAPASLGVFQQAFRWLLSWMAERGIHSPDQLDVQAYIDDLPRYLERHYETEEISIAQATRPLLILRWLWSERRLLQKWGVSTLKYNIFRDHGVDHYAKTIATKSLGWIPPLPDEVAIPLFNNVLWWLGAPADDVVRLLGYLDDSLSVTGSGVHDSQSSLGASAPKVGLGKKARLKRASKFLSDFAFSKLPGESVPWHGSLVDRANLDKASTPHERVRILFDAVREACCLCIQGLCGMRISELLGIKAGFDPKSGLPLGVRVENSETGLYQVYVIRTVLSKTEEVLPREMDWVLGMTPSGSQEEPLPVRALRILNGLFAPWRANAKTSRLILAGGFGDVLPLKSAQLGGITSDCMRSAMKRFIDRWVDLSNLPNESKHKNMDNDLVPWREANNRVFKTHMLRKSWAQFMFAVDSRLMPAIQMQFHHLTLAMTDTGYIGDNPLLVNDMESVATQARNQMIFEMVRGHSTLAGRMGEQLEKATKDLSNQVRGLSTSDAFVAVASFCEQAQLPIFFSPHGSCMPIHTHEMRCHDEAGTSLFLRTQPSYITRQPSLCVGCGCFVLDARHADFWAARYLDNWLAYQRAELRGKVDGYRVIMERAIQSGKLLKKIGVDLTPLDRQIKSTLEGEVANG